MRAQRRKAREERRQKQELERLRSEIKTHFIDKGDIKDHLAQIDMTDISGNYDKHRVAGVLGGPLLQLAIALHGIAALQGEDVLNAKKHPRELLANPGLFNLLLAYFKEMKNDIFTILVSQITMSLLESFKIGLNDLHKLNEDQLHQFKESMIHNPGHRIMKKLRKSPEFSTGFFKANIYDLLQSDIIDMVAKKLPSDIAINNQKLEQITQKIKFVPIPKSVIEESTMKEDVMIEANTNIKAVIRITVPMRTIQEEVEVLDPETLLPTKVLIDKQVEAD